MRTDLQRLDQTPTDVLVEISNDVERYVLAADTRDEDRALEGLSAKSRIVGRLFPTKYERERQRVDIENMRALAQSKLEMLSYYTDLQLAIARQRGDAFVAAQGTHLQATLAAFAVQKHAEL